MSGTISSACLVPPTGAAPAIGAATGAPVTTTAGTREAAAATTTGGETPTTGPTRKAKENSTS